MKCHVCRQAEEWHYGGPDFDTCQCGDYRHQHAGGTGRCEMPNDLTHGFKPCLAFRLHKEHHTFIAVAERRGK